MSGVQEQQASKLEKNNPLGKVADKVKEKVTGDDGNDPSKPTVGKNGKGVAEHDVKSAGNETDLPTMTGASEHPLN